MMETINEVRVRIAPDGFYPEAFRWAGSDVRVLSVEGMRTCGPERRFRVRTVEGVYELTQDTRAHIWRLRRSPTWFSRALAQFAQEPRYSPPTGSRRAVRAGRHESVPPPPGGRASLK
jgi:hypothetical protein